MKVVDTTFDTTERAIRRNSEPESVIMHLGLFAAHFITS